MLAFYKAMLALRKARPAIATGSYENVAVNGSAMSFQRRQGSEWVLVAINYGSGAATLSVSGLPSGYPPKAPAPRLL